MSSERDQEFMRRTFELARRGMGRVSPNPMVGCVIVSKSGKVLAEGYHKRYGGPHAEAVALRKLGGAARGATLYTNLEPCAHTRKRKTEPCAPKVLQAGVARVVIGALDPIRSHSGGARLLRSHGIDITSSVLRQEAIDLNRAFYGVAKHQRPYTCLKVALSLDGNIATRSGDSKWITGSKARKHAHRIRHWADAVVVGIQTVRADDPALTSRIRGGIDPVRVVVDSRLRTPSKAKLLPSNCESAAGTIIACTEDASHSAQKRLETLGAQVIRCGRGKRVSLPRLWNELLRLGIHGVMVEGGGVLHSACVRAGLVDEIAVYMAPRLLGRGHGWLDDLGIKDVHAAISMRFVETETLGNDMYFRLKVI